jgi:aminoglycoside phosphotransferase (APT) family kinase protein
MQVRLPKHASSTGQVEKELAILPSLAPALPVEVPRPVAHGMPREGYPFSWGVYEWLAGEPARSGTHALAQDVAAFLGVLQGIDTTGAPSPGSRGGPLTDSTFIRDSIARLPDEFDRGVVSRAWDRALAVPGWDRAPVWVHGDVLASNLLVRAGRLAVVLDWGTACAGDPACDLMIAWSLLDPVRAAFRAAIDIDGATWSRGRGWALWQAASALAYYRDTNPPMVAHARVALANVLNDADADGVT